MSGLSSSLILYESFLLAFCLYAAHVSRKNPLLLVGIGIFMIVVTSLLLGIFGIGEVWVALSKGEVAAANIKVELLLPTLFISFGVGAIGANLIASAITAKG